MRKNDNLLPVFVQYVYMRSCKHNPSIERFEALPKHLREDIWLAAQKRQRERRQQQKGKAR